MEHLDLYIYLALGGIYLISKLLKGVAKKQLPGTPGQQQAGDTPDQPQTNAKPRRRPAFSFEELLKEFEQQHEEKQPEPQPEPEPVKHVKKPAPTLEKEESPAYPTYEERPLEDDPIKHLEGSLVSDHFKRDEHYARNEEIVNSYIEMLREPGGLRNAIVMSEILNRKYF